MPHKIGPTGHYPLGEPLEPTDHGNIDIVFVIVPPCHAKMQFGTYLDWFFLTPQTGRTVVRAIRETIAEAYGGVEAAEDPPFTVSFNWERGVVMVDLPHTTHELVATAEEWLALMNSIEAELRNLM